MRGKVYYIYPVFCQTAKFEKLSAIIYDGFFIPTLIPPSLWDSSDTVAMTSMSDLGRVVSLEEDVGKQVLLHKHSSFHT